MFTVEFIESGFIFTMNSMEEVMDFLAGETESEEIVIKRDDTVIFRGLC